VVPSFQCTKKYLINSSIIAINPDWLYAVAIENAIDSFRLKGEGCRVQGSGFRLQASGFRVQASGFRLQASG
jgi:hypothetical protein